MRTTLVTLVPFYMQGPDTRGIFTKKWAVHTIISTRLNSGHCGYHSRMSEHGKGNKAKRRIERLRAQFEHEADQATHEWFDERLLSAADVDRLAEEHAAGRHFGARSVNFHD